MERPCGSRGPVIPGALADTSPSKVWVGTGLEVRQGAARHAAPRTGVPLPRAQGVPELDAESARTSRPGRRQFPLTVGHSARSVTGAAQAWPPPGLGISTRTPRDTAAACTC